MKRTHKLLILGGAVLLLGTLIISCLAAGSWLYMVTTLARARSYER